jgi:hypothetical protein
MAIETNCNHKLLRCETALRDIRDVALECLDDFPSTAQYRQRLRRIAEWAKEALADKDAESLELDRLKGELDKLTKAVQGNRDRQAQVVDRDDEYDTKGRLK